MGSPDRVQELEREVADLRTLFDMQWNRMGEATARWRAEDSEARALTMPDLGELLRWLMDDADRAREGVRHIGRCGSEREPDGSECMEQLYAAPADVQVKCPKCGGWQGVNAPGRPPGFLLRPERGDTTEGTE